MFSSGFESLPPATASVVASDGLDFISQLPNDILVSILFLLPLKDCVRTSILSSRWRNVWKLSPLRLDDSESTSSSQWPDLDDMFSLNPRKFNENRKARHLPQLTPYQMPFFDPSPCPDANPFDRPYNSRFYLILSSHYGKVHSLRLSGVKGLAFRGTVTRLQK
jgi:F-box domain